MDYREQHAALTRHCCEGIIADGQTLILFAVIQDFAAVEALLGKALTEECLNRMLTVLKVRTRKADPWFAPLPGVFALPLCGIPIEAAVRIARRLAIRPATSIIRSPMGSAVRVALGIAQVEHPMPTAGDWVECLLDRTAIMTADWD